MVLRRFIPTASNLRALKSSTCSSSSCLLFSKRFQGEKTKNNNNEQKEQQQQQEKEEKVDQERQQLVEHERFMKYLQKDAYVTLHACAPKYLCSVTRLDQNREQEPKAVQQAQGRGLIATKDIMPGQVIASAPLLDCAIFSDQVLENAQMKATSEIDGDDMIASYKSLPDLQTIQRIAAQTSGIRDSFVAAQAHLALCLALERCNEKSRFLPYFETLPHPAIDDKHMLNLFSALLGEDGVDQYGGNIKDYGRMLNALEKEWRKNSGGLVLVPPVQIINWAWRIVLSRQCPLPIYGKPELSHTEATHFGLKNASLAHFTQWATIHDGEPDAMMYPTLIPLFDLVDHGPVSNVRIDVVTRELDSSGEHQDSAAAAHNARIQHYPSHRENEGFFGRIWRETSSKVKEGVATLSSSSSSSNNNSDKNNKKKTSSSSSGGGVSQTAAFLELQSLTHIKAGTDLQTRFLSEQEEASFLIYRFGFFPVSYNR